MVRAGAVGIDRRPAPADRRMGQAMRLWNESARRAAALAAAGLIGLATAVVNLGVSTARAGDEPRGLGRIFRFGNRRDAEPSKTPADSQKPSTVPVPTHNHGPANGAKPGSAPVPNPGVGNDRASSPFGSLPAGGASYGSGTTGRSASPYGPASAGPYGNGNGDGYNPLSTPAATTPGYDSAGTNAPRIVPQPRVSRPVTDAPPLLTRVSIGRSDDGQRFGMFIQVYADGTVLSTEGIDHVGAEVLRPLVEALRAADLGREREHCGGPPTDFIEQVRLTVYDQNRGRLIANQLSFSGNTQGCDPAIRNLQAAIDAVQARVSTPVSAPTTPAVSPGLAPLGDAAPPALAPAPASGPSLSLTPYNE
jgi:hypothetical protein